jgi:hypothetical protein
MAKYLLLWSLTLVLAGSAASAEPEAPDLPLFVVEQAPATAPAQQCTEQAPAFEIKPKLTVSICQGNACTKTSDCRPAGVADCANCWCLGPVGDKSCGCF